jgi:hypothetical protein
LCATLKGSSAELVSPTNIKFFLLIFDGLSDHFDAIVLESIVQFQGIVSAAKPDDPIFVVDHIMLPGVLVFIEVEFHRAIIKRFNNELFASDVEHATACSTQYQFVKINIDAVSIVENFFGGSEFGRNPCGPQICGIDINPHFLFFIENP